MKKLVLGLGLGFMAVFGLTAFSNVDIQAEELDPEVVIEEVDEDLEIIKADIDALVEDYGFTVGYAKKIVILAQNDDTLTIEGLLELSEEEVTILFETAVTEGAIDMSLYRGAFAQAKAFMKGLGEGIGEGLGQMKGRLNDAVRGHSNTYDGDCPLDDTEDTTPDLAF